MRSAKVRAHVAAHLEGRKSLAGFDTKRDSQHWSETEFYDYMDGLDDELWNDDEYEEAIASGDAALPDSNQDDAALALILVSWRKHIKKYAADVPDRLATEIADTLNALEREYALPASPAQPATPDSPATPAEPAKPAPAVAILEGLDKKLESQESSVTRYADPLWGAGQQGYGEALTASDVLLVWELEDGADHCDDCPELADGGPYTADTIPSWPGDGGTECRDHCKCRVIAEYQSWNAAFSEGDEEN